MGKKHNPTHPENPGELVRSGRVGLKSPSDGKKGSQEVPWITVKKNFFGGEEPVNKPFHSQKGHWYWSLKDDQVLIVMMLSNIWN